MPGGPEGALGMGPDGMPPVMNGELYCLLSVLDINSLVLYCTMFSEVLGYMKIQNRKINKRVLYKTIQRIGLIHNHAQILPTTPPDMQVI